MAQKAITIYTPTTESAHIYAEDDALIHRAVFGGSGITEADEKLAYEVIDNNTVRVYSGCYCNSGFLHIIPHGSYIDLTIVSGTEGLYRRDLIVSDFTRGGGDVSDTLVFSVLTGTESSTESGAAAPALIQNDIAGNGARRQEAIYQILLNGASIQSVTRIAPYTAEIYGILNTRKVNGHALSQDIWLTPADIGAVPPERTICGQSLAQDITSFMPSDCNIIYSSTEPWSQAVEGTIWLKPLE